VDPATAARLAPRDAQRIQRALEVFHGTGRPLSSFQRRATGRARAADWPLITLEPASRAWLHARIATRFDAMLQAGFIDEVRALRARGDLHAGLPSMRCVGYRQAWEALDQDRLADLREAGLAATRQLAKRQLTWLRGMADRTVVACEEDEASHALTERVRRLACA
jgi:tRNA dimethylallyltransferase